LFSPTTGMTAHANLYSHNSRPTSEPNFKDPDGTSGHFMPGPPLKLSLLTPSPTRRPSRHHRSAGMLFRTPSSPTFYVHALTTTIGAEHWHLPACVAISSSHSTCLPPTRGARPLLTDSGAHLHSGHKEAAFPRAPTHVPEAREATAPVDTRLVRIFYTPAPLLPAQSGHLPSPTSSVYHWPTIRSPTTGAGQLHVRTCVPLPRRACRKSHCRHGGSPRPAHCLL
jgi:hypothetical protein